MTVLLLTLGCGADPAPEIVEGTGEFEGMVYVPAATVELGLPASLAAAAPPTPKGHGGGAHPPRGTPQGPPPPGTPGAPAQFGGTRLADPPLTCTDAEQRDGRCPATGSMRFDAIDANVSAFWIDRTEVTNAAYATFLEATGYRPPHVHEEWSAQDFNWQGRTPPAGLEQHPAVLASWYDAREYCAWKGRRLPTEAEWQLAANGPKGSATAYPWGNEYAEGRMNRGQLASPFYDDADGFLKTSPVGAFPKGQSRYGAHDMFGNAWEWVADLRVKSVSELQWGDAGARLNPSTTTLGLNAGARGFSYFADPRPMLAMGYNAFPTELRRKTSGFRCASGA